MVRRGLHDRGQPNTVNTEVIRGFGVAVIEVVQLLGDTVEVTNSTAV